MVGSTIFCFRNWSLHDISRADRSAPVPRWAPLGAPTSINRLDLIIQVLADLLQCLVYALEVIVSEAPAAALLGVIITVAEYRPPCPHLLALSVNDAAVNTHAVAAADLVVQCCALLLNECITSRFTRIAIREMRLL